MDLKDQLQKLFPEHISKKAEPLEAQTHSIWLQDEPLQCIYEKRKGKPITLIKEYHGAKSDFKELTKIIQSKLHVGGSFKNEIIVIQGNYRDQIMDILKNLGFQVKRVGG